MKAVLVDNISKCFTIRSFSLTSSVSRLINRTNKEQFWALSDVSLEVEQGEAIGFIGHNGAGKSTMLKLLTRIMEPTKGGIRTRGRVSALIEVGAGFHPEMTGKENIYLNGSILGMTRAEISHKFDAIVSFAEIDKFIDTPVKRYSSGMYARLGFAVAAHVDPDILIVDEVLSVGDAAFQRRCLEHMTKLRKSGCTVIFVSHNLQAVATMCDRGAVLAQGKLHYLGPVAEAIAQYTTITNKTTSQPKEDTFDNSLLAAKNYSGTAMIQKVTIQDENSHEISVLKSGSPVKIQMDVEFFEDAHSPIPSFYIRRNDGVVMYDVTSNWLGVDCGNYNAGDTARFEFIIDSLPLKSGDYSITTEVAYHNLTLYYDCKPNIASITIYDSGNSYGMLELPIKLVVSSGAGTK